MGELAIPDGFLAEWCEVLAHGTEMPPEAYLATGLVTVSAIVGPRLSMRWSQTRRERANLWVLNCGRSALARKTTGSSAASWAMRVAAAELGDQVRWYNAKRLSAAGLAADLDVLGADRAAAQRVEETVADVQKRKPQAVEATARPVPVSWLVGVNEVAPLWGEQGSEWQRETSGMLLDLFDGELVSRTRSTSVAAQETFVCALGNIPPAVLAERTSLATLTSGFAGRWLVLASPGPRTTIPTPRLNGTNPLAGLAEMIRHLARMAVRLSDPVDLAALWPEGSAADKARTRWYEERHAEHRTADPEDMVACARADLWGRLQATALKLGTLLAVCREAGRIDHLHDVRVSPEDARWAQDACDRSLAVLMEAVAEGGGGASTPVGKIENRIVSYLARRDARSEGKATSMRACVDSSKGRDSRHDAVRAIEGLIGVGVVGLVEWGVSERGGRPRRGVWLIDGDEGGKG